MRSVPLPVPTTLTAIDYGRAATPAYHILHQNAKTVSFFTKNMGTSNPTANADTITPEVPNGNRDLRMLCENGRLKEALRILCLRNFIDSDDYASLLQGCLKLKALIEGKLIHSHIIETGFKPDIFLGTKLVIMYGKCGSVLDARRYLDNMPEQNVVSWSSMISAYAKHGRCEEALKMFSQMQNYTSFQPNQFTFAGVLAACADLKALDHGREIHRDVIRNGLQSNACVGTALVVMYGKCGNIESARKLFDRIPYRDVVTWNAMITGYMQNNSVDEAVALFGVMPERNVVSWTAMITGYVQNGLLDDALDMFQKMPERNVVSWNAMIAGYVQSGDVNDALRLFQRMPERNVVSWTAMIAGYVQNGCSEEAVKLYRQMGRMGVKPNSDTFASSLAACANLADLHEGREIHEEIIRARLQGDVFVGSALVDMYAKCGSIKDACQVFEQIPKRDIALWNAMISGYVHNGHVDEAFKFFQKMPERNVVSWNAMIAGLAQNGYMDDSLTLFHKMPMQDTVSWTTMIAGYVQNGCFDKALEFFQQMRLVGVKPHSETFASILSACASLAFLLKGKEIHAEIIRCGFESDISVGNALVDTYAKCGCKEDARKVFDKMHRRDVVSWNAMIVGCAVNGYGNEALHLFEQMQQFCMQPNQITFVGVLSACCHAGLVDHGWKYFDNMEHNYNITPTVEHFCCMVDLLGRAGRLDEAQNLINNMPIKADAAVWASLLGACRVHSNIKLGECVADHLFESNSEVAAHYVLLSNIYATAGRWDDVEKVRELMKDKRVKKMPGRSWIEVNDKMYTFIVGNR